MVTNSITPEIIISALEFSLGIAILVMGFSKVYRNLSVRVIGSILVIGATLGFIRILDPIFLIKNGLSFMLSIPLWAPIFEFLLIITVLFLLGKSIPTVVLKYMLLFMSFLILGRFGAGLYYSAQMMDITFGYFLESLLSDWYIHYKTLFYILKVNPDFSTIAIINTLSILLRHLTVILLTVFYALRVNQSPFVWGILSTLSPHLIPTVFVFWGDKKPDLQYALLGLILSGWFTLYQFLLYQKEGMFAYLLIGGIPIPYIIFTFLVFVICFVYLIRIILRRKKEKTI